MPDVKSPWVIWRRWNDPLAPLFEFQGGPESELEEALARQAEDLSGEPAAHAAAPRQASGQLGPAVVGPMGIIPVHEHGIPSRLYKFWMGHTRCDLTRGLAERIAETEGVESLDVFTRYRFRLGVGFAFRSDHTLERVADVIAVYQQKRGLSAWGQQEPRVEKED